MICLKDELFLDLLKAVRGIYRRILPEKIRRKNRIIRKKIRYLCLRMRAMLFGNGYAYFCPCCGIKVPGFISGRYTDRPEMFDPKRYVGLKQEIICPVCGSAPRHRILAVWCEEHKDKIGGEILYFALEESMRMWMKRYRIRYVSADLNQPADLKIDIQQMDMQDNSWDWIFCNHVLEHVPDHKKALRELYRVLKPGGQLIISFPIDEVNETMIEDVSASREERIRRFGQADHYRVFGRDSEEMLQKAGFTVTRIESREADGSILPVVGPADYDVNYLFLCGK